MDAYSFFPNKYNTPANIDTPATAPIAEPAAAPAELSSDYEFGTVVFVLLQDEESTYTEQSTSQLPVANLYP